MAGKTTWHNQMRIWHRYLGFFLAGIMAVYALSGIVMIFRSTDFLKREETVKQQLKPNMSAEELGQKIRIRDLKFGSENGDVLSFKTGTYNKATGDVEYIVKSWPKAIDKLTQLHKANTKSPLFYLNIFFGVSLFFFVLSSFWMFMPGTTIFRKGLYFVLAGVVLTLIMLFV
ncbi:MAG TPA: PepSY domain-containing protein [Chitinophagaceae bacterium]|nr:PepSY domain-containing protein [Chitinophagaceae bacterium]